MSKDGSKQSLHRHLPLQRATDRRGGRAQKLEISVQIPAPQIPSPARHKRPISNEAVCDPQRPARVEQRANRRAGGRKKSRGEIPLTAGSCRGGFSAKFGDPGPNHRPRRDLSRLSSEIWT